MSARYLVESWQGLLQQLVYLFGRGYHYYHITYYPMEKQDKWVEIDQKLIAKYQTDKSKYQRARLKKKGKANFFFLRWENVAIIVHTRGEVDSVYDDKFSNVLKKPLTLQVNTVLFDIVFLNKKGRSERSVSVRLNKNFYRDMKVHLAEIAQMQDKRCLITEFRKINNFPAWAGIVAQKRNLLNYIIKQAKRNRILITDQDKQKYFVVRDKRKIYKVWKEGENG